MAIIGLTSAHGSPGVTSLAVALAHQLPAVSDRDVLLVEADADGGTMAVRHQLNGSSGFTALAGAARSGIEPADLLRFAAPLPSGVLTVVAHPAAEQAHAALRAGAGHVATALSGLTAGGGLDIVIDLGRLRPDVPSTPLARVCDVLLVVTRPIVEQLVAVADRLATYGSLAPVRVVLVGNRPYGAAEVCRVLQLASVHLVADDRDAVVADPSGSSRRRRARWAQSVRALAADLSVVGGVPGTAADEPDGDEPQLELVGGSEAGR